MATKTKRSTKKPSKEAQAEADEIMLAFNLLDDVEERVKSGKLKIDFRGHFAGYHEGWFERSLMMMLMSLRSDKKTMEILKNRHEGKKDDRPVYLTHWNDLVCASCCRETKFKLTNTKLTADTACPHPDGYPAYTVRINVPSGKLIFGNDFRDIVEIDASYDVNRTRGSEQTSRAYADAGMIHITVGNTCPGLYKVSETRINVLSPETHNIYAETGTEDDADPDANLAKPPKGEHVGGICTDLWWYSAMDYDLFKKIAKKKYGKDWKKRTQGCDIVKVKPGCYKAVGQAHLVRDRDTHYDDEHYYCAEEMYSYIKRDGDVRKLKPQSGYGEAAAFLQDFERAVDITRMAWTSISRDRNAILSHWFLVIGNGMEWNNGALIHVSGREEDAIERYKNGERPDWTNERDDYTYERRMAELSGEEFVKPHGSYYPICDYSRCWSVPDDVRPDWLAGVREILHVVIEHGTGPKPPKDAPEHIVRDYKTNKSNIKQAKLCLKSLEERFGPE